MSQPLDSDVESGTQSAPERSRTKLVFLVATVVGTLALVAVFGLNTSITRTPFVDTHEAAQVLQKPEVTVMGTDTLNKAYNLLRGEGANAVTARSIGRFTIAQKKTVEYGQTVYYQPDQVDMTMNSQCWGTQQSREYFTTYSTKQANSFAKESTFQMDTSASGGYSDKVGNSVQAGMEMSLYYGNSFAMKKSREYSRKGYSTASNSFMQSSLFEVFVDWETPAVPFKYSEPFEGMVTELNKKYTNAKARRKIVVKFFERFGTHVIRDASYGARCTMTTFMEDTSTSSAVSSFVSEAAKKSFSLNVWAKVSIKGATGEASNRQKKTKSYKQETATSGTFGSGSKYTVGNIRCEGTVQENLCSKEFNAQSDNPVMINYAPMPIWYVKGSDLAATGVANLRQVYGEILRLWAQCSASKCRNAGACTMSSQFWELVGRPEYDGTLNPKVMFAANCIPKTDKTRTSVSHRKINTYVGIGTLKHTHLSHGWGYKAMVMSNRIPDHLTPNCPAPRQTVFLSGFVIDHRWDPNVNVFTLDGRSKTVDARVSSHGWCHLQMAQIGFIRTCDPRIHLGVQGLSNNRVVRIRYQQFNKCPLHKRRLFIAASGFHNGHNKNLKFHLYVQNQYRDIRAFTWGDARFFGAQVSYANWCATQLDASIIQTGHVQVPFNSRNYNHNPLAYPPNAHRKWTTVVSYSQKRCNHPEVTVGFIRMEIWDQRNQRIRMSVSRVTRWSFMLAVETWGDARVYQVWVSWLAYCP